MHFFNTPIDLYKAPKKAPELVLYKKGMGLMGSIENKIVVNCHASTTAYKTTKVGDRVDVTCVASSRIMQTKELLPY